MCPGVVAPRSRRPSVPPGGRPVFQPARIGTVGDRHDALGSVRAVTSCSRCVRPARAWCAACSPRSGRDEACPGERTALHLAGASVDELPRGEAMLGSGPWRARPAARRELTLVRRRGGARHGDVVGLHLLAARTPGRVERLGASRCRPAAPPRGAAPCARVFAARGSRRLAPASPALSSAAVRCRVDPPRLRAREPPGSPSYPTRAAISPPHSGAGSPTPASSAATVSELAARAALQRPHSRRRSAACGRRSGSWRPPVDAGAAGAGALAALERGTALLADAGSARHPSAELIARLARPRPVGCASPARPAARAALRVVGGRATAADAAPLEDPLTGRVERPTATPALLGPSPGEVRSGSVPRKGDRRDRRFLIDQRRLAGSAASGYPPERVDGWSSAARLGGRELRRRGVQGPLRPDPQARIPCSSGSTPSA